MFLVVIMYKNAHQLYGCTMTNNKLYHTGHSDMIQFVQPRFLCSLFCFPCQSRRAADNGDYSTAMKKGKEALTLNIVSIVVGFVLLMIFTVVLPILAGIIVPLVVVLTVGNKGRP